MTTATLAQPSAGTRAITVDAIFCAISGSALVLFNDFLCRGKLPASSVKDIVDLLKYPRVPPQYE